MDREQKEQRILNFLTQCRNPSAQAVNIARFLGLRSARDVLGDLRRMQTAQLIRRTENNEWQLSGRAASPASDACGPAGETGATADRPREVPASVNHSDGRSRTAGQTQLTACVNGSRQQSNSGWRPSRRSGETANNISVSCLINVSPQGGVDPGVRIRMSHTCLCLPSRSWYSFIDPGGMEG